MVSLAVTESKVWMLDRKVFQQIMMRTGLQRLQDNINFLKSVPLLQNLSNEVLAKIADVLEVVRITNIEDISFSIKHVFVFRNSTLQELIL